MYPNTLSERPNQGAGYVPYFYQRGLHYLYPINDRHVPPQGHERAPAEYDFASVDAPFHPVERPQTVEQIIACGYLAIPRAEPETAILLDKAHTSFLGLDDMITQIRQRYEIYHQNLHHIELGKCAAMNAVYAHIAYQGPPDSKQMYARHKAFQRFYEQECAERADLWKDISRLRGTLPEAAQMYLGAYRKRAILQEEPGEPE